MSNNRKYINTQYSPKQDSLLNPAQVALFKAARDYGISGMKISDVPEYLNKAGDELKSTMDRIGAPTALGGLLGQSILSRVQKKSPLKFNILEQYGTYDKDNLSLRFGRLSESDVNTKVHPNTFGITGKYKF